MTDKSKIKVNLSSVKKKLRFVALALEKGNASEKLVEAIVDGVREDSINWKTGKKFHALTDEGKAGRKYLAKYNSTHKAYSPTEPNLTITGKFLDSIKAETSLTKKAILWEINASGTHPGYNTGAGRTSPIANRMLRAHLQDIDRDPLGMSKKTKEVLTKTIEKIISSILKKT